MRSQELRQILVLANAFKEGDLAVGGTRDDRMREEARRELLATTISRLRRTPLIEDSLTDALDRTRDRTRDADLDPLTVGDIKRTLLSADGPVWARAHRAALPSEAIAAVTKVMSDDEIGAVSRRLFNPLSTGDTAIGAPFHLGSRIQPNSPGDDEQEILFSILEGLTYGCGDVIIGLNPAADDLDTIVRLEHLLERVVRQLDLPTRYCVLSDIVKQHRARERARVDVGFQSLAGTSSALTGMVGLDIVDLLDLARSFDGLYFETGQGSEVTNGTADDVDMVTLEARTYGAARHIRTQTGAWMIVNDVAGFIGPEVFGTVGQLERACLEDTMMAKLHGITMGLDVCATFHMGITPAALREVTDRIVRKAAPAYLMAVAGNADPMLGYLTTSFRDHPRMRQASGRSITNVMQHRLSTIGVLGSRGAPTPDREGAAKLYALYTKAHGDERTTTALHDEGRRILHELRDRGFDLGLGWEGAYAAPAAIESRLDAIYTHARRALYATLDDAVIRDACPRSVRLRTQAADREDYLAHPAAGERLCDEDARTVSCLYQERHPQVQLVISDGLNANAINEQLRVLLPPLRRLLADAALGVGQTDVVIHNARVRAGYHVGALVESTVIVHLIGERPGTGLNTMSAYLTYGRDQTGTSRWNPAMNHSWTTAVCGIHPRGKPVLIAATEIVGTIVRMIAQRRSGVALQPPTLQFIRAEAGGAAGDP